MKQCTCYALRAIDCTCKPAKYGELYTSPTAKQEQCAKLAEDLGADGYDSEKIAYFIRARKPLNVFTVGETIHRE